MKISTRLVAGFGLLIILLTLCTGTALRALHHAREGMDDTVNIKMKKYQLAQEMFGQIRDIGIAVRNVDPDTFVNNWAHLIDRVKKMTPVLSEPGVMEALLRTDVMAAAELLAMTHAVGIIENFMRCLEHQTTERSLKPR